MLTSLRAISDKARRDKKHKFRNLASSLNEDFLIDSWRYMNKRSATGVDRVSAKDYGKSLRSNVRSLVTRLKTNRYRAKLIRRVMIPKANGKQRPLGIPATEDKLLQTAVARILNAIFDCDFLDVSYGYREKLGARKAVEELTHSIQFGRYTYVVEADIKSFFDTIDHTWLLRMLAERIDDRRFLRLISKWLKAGVLTAGNVEQTTQGTPQGGIVSPILANIYLHYALDLWFENVVKKHCEGDAELIRYADDFVCCFQFARDAERFYKALVGRLGKFGLQLAENKTRTIKFTRFAPYGLHFDFLGFEFRWGFDRKGKTHLLRRTAKRRLQQSLAAFKTWIRENRHLRLRNLLGQLTAKLRGYYNYFGLIGNSARLSRFYYEAIRMLHKYLNRRSQRRGFTYPELASALERYAVPKPKIVQIVNTQMLLSSC